MGLFPSYLWQRRRVHVGAREPRKIDLWCCRDHKDFVWTEQIQEKSCRFFCIECHFKGKVASLRSKENDALCNFLSKFWGTQNKKLIVVKWNRYEALSTYWLPWRSGRSMSETDSCTRMKWKSSCEGQITLPMKALLGEGQLALGKRKRSFRKSYRPTEFHLAWFLTCLWSMIKKKMKDGGQNS